MSTHDCRDHEVFVSANGDTRTGRTEEVTQCSYCGVKFHITRSRGGLPVAWQVEQMVTVPQESL